LNEIYYFHNNIIVIFIMNARYTVFLFLRK